MRKLEYNNILIMKILWALAFTVGFGWAVELSVAGCAPKGSGKQQGNKSYAKGNFCGQAGAKGQQGVLTIHA
jgi:hypothetical protein